MNDRDKTRAQLQAENEELRRRIAAIESNETRWRSVAENAPLFVAVVDRSGNMQFLNRFLPGFAPATVLGRPIYDFLQPEYHAVARECLEHVFQTGERTSFENRGAGPQGSMSEYVTDVGPVMVDGEIVAATLLAKDITDRKRAEAALQQALDELERRVEQRTAELTKANEDLVLFRKFAESSSQGFGISDVEGRIVYANPALSRAYGEDNPQDAIGKYSIDYYPAEWRERRKTEVLPSLEREGRWQGEMPILTRQGRLIPTLHHVFLLRDEQGNPVCRCVVVTDITDRKRAEEAMRQSRDELQAIHDGMVDGLLVTDIETLQFARVNASICRMLGYSETELRTLSIKDLHPAEALPYIVERIRSLREGQQTTMGTVPFLRKDGNVFYAEVIGRFLTYNGRPCSIAIFRDITERRQAQEALEREHRTLRHLLQSSDHERQVIAYEIHDGLAQHLAGAIMQFDAYAYQKDSQPRFAARAFDAGMTMLHQGHAEARRLISGVRPPILDEEGIVAAVVHLVNDQQKPKGPTIEYATDMAIQRLAPILENALYRIAQEALTNACRHSQSKKVRMELVQRGEQIRIEVRDQGVGFNLDDIGESRFGLAGIRERARLLGGKALFESEPGKGTRIVVEVPIIRRRAEDD